MLSESASLQNELLALLPPSELRRLLPKLSWVALPSRQPLYDPERPVEAAYFPLSGMISLVANLEDGRQAEVGIIGREGVLGVSLISGIETPFIESMVQIPGEALRMRAADFRLEMETSAEFRTVLLRYNEALHAQVMQTAACNSHHGLEQRFARWLLMAHDRVGADELSLTQDFMAMMLGVVPSRMWWNRLAA